MGRGFMDFVSNTALLTRPAEDAVDVRGDLVPDRLGGIEGNGYRERVEPDQDPTAPSPAPSSSSTGEDRFSEYVLPELEVMGRVALSLTRSASDAEDLVQETLLRAYRAIDRFDGRYPRAWLLTIMRNAQVNRVRRRRPELLRDPEDAVRTMSDTDGEGSTTEDRAMHGQFDSVVESAFNELPVKFREVVELVDLNQLSYAEAAEILDVPVGTIMSRLHRGRKRIRDHLGPDHPAAKLAASRQAKEADAAADGTDGGGVDLEDSLDVEEMKAPERASGAGEDAGDEVRERS